MVFISAQYGAFSVPVEALKSLFDIAAVVLLFLTFAAGAGVLITGNIINRRQEEKLRKFESDLTAARFSLAEQHERAANADARVAELEQKAADAGTAMAKQQERAANAERSLLELHERVKPRRLTEKQETAFVKALSVLPTGTINFGYTSGGGDEGFNFAKQFLPLFKQAKWTIQNEASITNHLEIQVIGVGILIHSQTDPAKPPSAHINLTPTLSTLQSAFRTVGIEVQFINWHPGNNDTPEVVVGSKPEP